MSTEDTANRLAAIAEYQVHLFPAEIPSKLCFGRNSTFHLQSGLVELAPDVDNFGKHSHASFFASVNAKEQRFITVQNMQGQFEVPTRLEYTAANNIIFASREGVLSRVSMSPILLIFERDGDSHGESFMDMLPFPSLNIDPADIFGLMRTMSLGYFHFSVCASGFDCWDYKLISH